VLPVDGGALGDREVRLEAFELPDRLSAIPGCQQVQHPGADWPGLEHAAIEHGGIDQIASQRSEAGKCPLLVGPGKLAESDHIRRTKNPAKEAPTAMGRPKNQ
jgi:hypothetical protein